MTNLTVTQAKEQLTSKKISSVELVQSYLDEIAKINPKINAVLSLNENALIEAKQANTNLPLGGVPILIKDNFLTIGIKTTASSKVLENYQPQYDATVVKKLKAAGAIILGKTNMDAWAHGSSTETSDFGPTLNPIDSNYLPGGSSGGSAAAVAANLCPAAIGSETAGSIRQPAAWCGVVGFKPSYGRVSRYGVIAMASSTDSPGPLTRTVTDAALITQVMAGVDPYDATTSPIAVNTRISSVNKLKIGLPKEYLEVMQPAARDLVLKAAQKMRDLGHGVEEMSLLHPKYSIGVYTIIQRSEVSSNLARFDGIRYGHDRSFFGPEAKRRVMLGTYALSSGYYDQYYAKAQKVRSLIIADFQSAFQKFDLLINPASPGPALKVGATAADPMFGENQDILVEPSSIAGLTGISVPCGLINGLPISFGFIGPQFSESLVLSAAAAYTNEQPTL